MAAIRKQLTSHLVFLAALLSAALFALALVPSIALAEEAGEDELVAASDDGSEDEGDETAVVTVTFDVTYFQTEARSMLEMINEFRTSETDAWAWDETDTEKVYYTDLGELSYSYALEEVAMQRAAEIALFCSHTRTDGSDNLDAFAYVDLDASDYSYTYSYTDGTYTYIVTYGPGENIAYGASTANDGVVEDTIETNEDGEDVVVSDEYFASAEEAFEAWLEEDYGYDGQGHRRNMLGDYNAIGIACAYCNGGYFWVQVLGYVDDEADDAEAEAEGAEGAESDEVEANDSVTTVTVDVSADYVMVSSVVPDSESYILTVGETAETPTVLVFLENEASATTEGLVVATATASWTSSNEGVVAIAEDGSIVGVSTGTATLTATVLGYEVSITVEVVTEGSHTHDYSTDQTWRWYADGTVTVTFTCAFDECGVTTTVEAEAEVTEATCDEDAYTTYTATATLDDGTTVTDERVVTVEGTATGHVYGEPEWTWADDCSSATATFTCSACGETMTVDAEVTSESTSSSCEEDGTTTYTATVVLDETAYTATASVAVAATGHSYGEGVVTDPTCTEDGYITYPCSVCGASYTEEGEPATGHSYDEGAVTTEATCTEDGVLTYTCTACGASYTETIAATGHSYGEGVVTDPTCTEAGYTTYTCTACGDTYTADETAALGHSYGEAAWAWTAVGDGYAAVATFTCANDSSHVETVEADVEVTATVDATYEAEGSITYTATATFNDAVYTDEYVVSVAQLEAVTYEVIDGNDEEVSVDAGSDLTVTASGEVEDFAGLYVDGDLVDEDNYTLTSGSTIVTLKASYLATLEAGTHTLTFLYNDGGTASTTFTVQAAHTHTYSGVPTAQFSSDLAIVTATMTCTGCGEVETVVTTDVETEVLDDGTKVLTAYVTFGDTTYKVTGTIAASSDDDVLVGVDGEAEESESEISVLVSESTDLVSSGDADDDEADEADEDADEDADEEADDEFSATGDSLTGVVVAVIVVAAIALVIVIIAILVRRRRAA